MNAMPLVAVVVAWLVAAIIVVSLRGKQLSSRFCLVTFLCSSLGAGAVQYGVQRGLRQTERLSAARLAGVSCLRVKEDAEFVRLHLLARRAAGKDDQPDATQVDWVSTFQLKAGDISATLAAVERNDLIRNSYSVWLGDIEWQRDQLDRLAKLIVAMDEGSPRQTTVEHFVESVERAADQLERLAHEMRSNAPEAYYE